VYGWNKDEFFGGTKTIKDCKHTVPETLSSDPQIIDKSLFLKFIAIHLGLTLLDGSC
jgi:hypothetical protein